MSEHSDHLVRPRWVWGGTGTAVAGTVVAGIGVGAASWTWTVPGLVLLAAGGVAALHGGVLNDVHATRAARHELRDLVEGRVHQGVAAGQTRSTPEGRAHARDVEHRLRRLEAATTAAHAPRGPLAGIAWLVVATFLLFAQWTLYPIGLPGQTNANRALAVAIVLGLAGLRIVTAPQRGHHVAAGLAGLAGLLLVLDGLLAPHAVTATAAAEVVCGALALLGAAVGLADDR